MTDYKSLKVPELKDLLQKRSLAISGNKADLIARLEEADSSVSSSAAPDAPAFPCKSADQKPKRSVSPIKSKSPVKAASAPKKPATAPTDEIDWDDDAPTPKTNGAATKSSTIPAPAAPADTPVASGQTPAAAAPPETSLNGSTDPKTNEASTSPEATQAPKSFAANLPPSEIDTELEKRKKRAARFGTPAEQSDEASKTLERTKKFGGESAGGETGDAQAAAVGIKGLDSGLPERMRRERVQKGQKGQKRESEDEGGRGSTKRNKSENAGHSDKPRGTGQPSAAAGGKGVLSDPKEKAKAEERAKRFAVTA